MQFITGTNRHQTYFGTLEDLVAADNLVRLIDAFVDKLDLQQLGFLNTSFKSEGRPPFAHQVLLSTVATCLTTARKPGWKLYMNS